MTFIPIVVSNVSVGNSTIVPLEANGVFTGTGEDVSIYASISVALTATGSGSPTGNIFFQFSDTQSFDMLLVTTAVPVTATVAEDI
jgi:hypothetical protein